MEEKLKILLCEDDENLGMLLREYLQAKNFECKLCPDGEIGYREFFKEKYDICVLDVRRYHQAQQQVLNQPSLPPPRWADERDGLFATLFWSGERQLATLVLIGDNELIALAVDVDDLNLVVVLQVLAQLGDVNVHRACIEVVVINPDGLQRKVALQDLVGMSAEKSEKLILLGCQLGLLAIDGKQLLLCIEGELTDVIHGRLL